MNFTGSIEEIRETRFVPLSSCRGCWSFSWVESQSNLLSIFDNFCSKLAEVFEVKFLVKYWLSFLSL